MLKIVYFGRASQIPGKIAIYGTLLATENPVYNHLDKNTPYFLFIGTRYDHIGIILCEFGKNRSDYVGENCIYSRMFAEKLKFPREIIVCEFTLLDVF